MNRLSQNALSEVLLGAWCGIAATVPMSVNMLVVERLLRSASRQRQEPRQITDELLDRWVGEADIADAHRRAAALVAHFGYGAAAGAAYPVVARTMGRWRGRGPAYGVALFAVSYAGWLPACHILPPPSQRPWGRNVLLITSHFIWGAAVEYCYSVQADPAVRVPAFSDQP